MQETRLQGPRVVLVPVAADHVPELRRILAAPEVALRWRDEALSPGWPFDDDSVSRFAVMDRDVVRGMVQHGGEGDPDTTSVTTGSSSTRRPTTRRRSAATQRSGSGPWG